MGDTRPVDASRASLRRLDLAGVGLVAFAAGWSAISVAAAGGNANPTVGLLAAVSATFAGARLASRWRSWTVPAAIVAAVAVLAVSSGDPFGSKPLSGPFGYVNAAGALWVQVVVASLMITAATRSPAARAVGLAGATVFAAAAIASGSAAAALLLAAPAVSLLAKRAGRPQVGVAVLAASLALVLVATVALAVTGRGAAGIVDERRIALWRDAVALISDHPLVGVGPGRFAVTSPEARADRDARWAHHGFLQQGAETGIPGLVLLVLIFSWTIAALAVRAGTSGAAGLAVAAVAALGVGACVDYLLHFPVLPIVAAALAGAGTATRRPTES